MQISSIMNNNNMLLNIQVIIDVALFCNLFVPITTADTCGADGGEDCSRHEENKYSEAVNKKWSINIGVIEDALKNFTPCQVGKNSCHYDQIDADLKPFKDGITKQMIEDSMSRGTQYQIIDHKLYRENSCMFPSRCKGIEHFILNIIDQLPDMDLIINTRDWPQVDGRFNQVKPVFSFSKTPQFLDIMYPAWSFWEGGPAISLYPTGIGRWDLHLTAFAKEIKMWPWEKKKNKAFFRGSRTSAERDPLIYLSREHPELVDAQYTKNQAWKSDADTLYAHPAKEVTLEHHCHYKYLFNFRGVAASFRLKYLFLCRSLVFHVGDEWKEFFYPQLKPWVHYIPVSSSATEEEIKHLLEFVRENGKLAEEIANRGYEFILNHLRMNDIKKYWKKVLINYSKLLKYSPIREDTLNEIKQPTLQT